MFARNLAARKIEDIREEGSVCHRARAGEIRFATVAKSNIFTGARNTRDESRKIARNSLLKLERSNVRGVGKIYQGSRSRTKKIIKFRGLSLLTAAKISISRSRSDCRFKSAASVSANFWNRAFSPSAIIAIRSKLFQRLSKKIIFLSLAFSLSLSLSLRSQYPQIDSSFLLHSRRAAVTVGRSFCARRVGRGVAWGSPK